MANGGNVEIVENPNRIAQRVRAVPGGNVDVLLERVEQVILRHGDEFIEIYHRDVERIGAHMAAAMADPAAIEVSVKAIRASLHDLRGQAGTFGYGLVTQISDSACKFIDLSETFSRPELAVLNMHVDALRAAEQQKISGDGGETGGQLMEGLRTVIRKHGAGDLDRRRLAEIIGER